MVCSTAPHRGDREEALEVAGRVPVHHRDRLARLHSQGGEPRRETSDAAPQRAVVVPASVAVDNFASGRDGRRGVQEVVEGERIVVGLAGDDQIVRSHVRSLPVRCATRIMRRRCGARNRTRWNP